MWSSINPEEVKKLLETKSIEEVARHFKMSKWVMYKYTSYYKIDVWECKRIGKKNIPAKPKRPLKKRQEKIYNSAVYGDLTPEKLTVLLKKYTPFSFKTS